MSRRADNASNREQPSSIYASDDFDWRPYSDGSGGGWQAGYHGCFGHGSTKRKAFDDLNRELVACGEAPAICLELIA